MITEDVDVAAAIMTGTGIKPAITYKKGESLAVCKFPDDSRINDIILQYATGQLLQPVKKFAANRAWLYRQVRDASKR